MAMRVNLLPLAVRTSSATSPVVNVWEKYQAAHVYIDYHPYAGGGLTVTLYGKDDTSQKSYSILSTNLVASGFTVMKVGPEYTAGANVAKDYVPYSFYVGVTGSGTNEYSISASVM